MNRKIQPTGYNRDKDIATLKIGYKTVFKRCPHWYGTLLLRWYWLGMTLAYDSLLTDSYRAKRGITRDDVRRKRDLTSEAEAEFDKTEYYNNDKRKRKNNR